MSLVRMYQLFSEEAIGGRGVDDRSSICGLDFLPPPNLTQHGKRSSWSVEGGKGE